MKKTKLLTVLLLPATLIIALSVFRKPENYGYSLSLFLLIAGMMIYPVNYKFREKKDFMVLPLWTVVVFNIINVFYLDNYTDKMALVNVLMGLYGFLQFFYYRQKSSKESNE